MEISSAQIAELVKKVLSDMGNSGASSNGLANGEVPVGVSNRHIHLNKAYLPYVTKSAERQRRNATYICIFPLIDDTHYYSITRRHRIMQRQTCGATRRNEYRFSDTCANAVYRNEIFSRELAILHDFHFHEFRADEGFLLSGGNDISPDNSS